MESNYKLEELKKIFFFLAGITPNEELKVPFADLVFGLDNYAMNMDKDKKDDLKNALSIRKDMEENIEFEDFKEFFDLDKNSKKLKNEDYQKTANQIFFLILEILGPKNIKNNKLSKENIKNIFELIFCWNETDCNNKNGDKYIDNKNKDTTTPKGKMTINDNNNEINIHTLTLASNQDIAFCKKLKNDFLLNNNLYNSLVECIDLDGDDMISLTDFEFLIHNYYNCISKEN
jgi:hypothetical protein